MLSRRKKSPFEAFFKELKKFEGKLSKTASKELEKLYNSICKKILKKKFKFWSRSVTTKITKSYRHYVKAGYMERNKGIKGWRLDAIKPQLQKELRARLNVSLGLISSNAAEMQNEMRRRFLGFLSGDDRSNAREKLAPVENINRKDKRVQMTITDQTRKMIGSFDRTVAGHFKAIAFIWNGREDKRESGNPSGLYPDADDKSSVHGDHWSRNNKLYFFEDTWVLKEGLINKKSKNFRLAKFNDGLPSEPINCRCWQYNLYDLEDIYERDKSLISKKGLKYLENKL